MKNSKKRVDFLRNVPIRIKIMRKLQNYIEILKNYIEILKNYMKNSEKNFNLDYN